MAGSVTFTIRSSNGVEVSGAVGEASLRRMYEAGAGGFLATQFCSDIGGETSELSIPLPMNFDVATLDALKDVLQDFVAQGGQGTCEAEGRQTQRVRLTYEIAPGPFLAALDFLQVPTGDGPIFDTVAAKWKYEATSQLKAIREDLVTQFLEPAFFGCMNFGPSSMTVVIFQHKVASVRPHEDYAMGFQHGLTECANITRYTNLVVFGSVQEKRPHCKGSKYDRMYEVADGSPDIMHGIHAPRLRTVLVEKEVLVAELFKGSFQRELFIGVILAARTFKGLGVETIDGADAILLCAPWAV